jgi:hypothetical protein
MTLGKLNVSTISEHEQPKREERSVGGFTTPGDVSHQTDIIFLFLHNVGMKPRREMTTPVAGVNEEKPGTCSRLELIKEGNCTVL